MLYVGDDLLDIPAMKIVGERMLSSRCCKRS